ncbi:hypothetical protein NPIL_163451 [Nephila pilipes]|uniref:Uncharacterized protein n=1 Tax=Nephila pilipes TaxID=299642 RepID=A0A8X6U8M1_NEPPI|nr:hypothetical protein NPIL_163451 [Nephila pilipes]
MNINNYSVHCRSWLLVLKPLECCISGNGNICSLKFGPHDEIKSHRVLCRGKSNGIGVDSETEDLLTSGTIEETRLTSVGLSGGSEMLEFEK